MGGSGAGEVARLRAEVERLLRKVEALEQALYGGATAPHLATVPPQERVMLRLLLARDLVSGEQTLAAIEADSPSPDGRNRNHVSVLAYRLRRSLRPLGVDVQHRREAGYWISPADKARLLAREARPSPPRARRAERFDDAGREAR